MHFIYFGKQFQQAVSFLKINLSSLKKQKNKTNKFIFKIWGFFKMKMLEKSMNF